MTLVILEGKARDAIKAEKQEQEAIRRNDVMNTCDAKGLVYDYEGSDEQCS